jgi:uncharacterized protein (DUF488 family)
MERRVQEVKGSFVVSLPRSWAKERGISKGSQVQVEERREELVISAGKAPVYLGIQTIGYEGHDLESFTKMLLESQVECLVDVRQLPLSRKRGFSKNKLAAHLASRGISYEHIPELGAPKAVRDPFKRGGPFEKFEAAYKEHLGRQTAALDRLKGVSVTKRTAIMCVEADPAQCHRSIVADAMLGVGFGVHHIRSSVP